ncbi:MAG: hypothetical protein ACRD0K_24475 [Egibacteraceae bacterium]
MLNTPPRLHRRAGRCRAQWALRTLRHRRLARARWRTRTRHTRDAARLLRLLGATSATTRRRSRAPIAAPCGSTRTTTGGSGTRTTTGGSTRTATGRSTRTATGGSASTPSRLTASPARLTATGGRLLLAACGGGAFLRSNLVLSWGRLAAGRLAPSWPDQPRIRDLGGGSGTRRGLRGQRGDKGEFGLAFDPRRHGILLYG